MSRNTFLQSLGIALVGVVCIGAVALAGDWDDCDGWRHDDDWGDRGRFCEVREITVPATGSLVVDAGQNGGIGVQGWDSEQIEVAARVTVWRSSEPKAREIAQQIEISTNGGRVEASGPSDDRWSVSYRVHAPHLTDLDLEAHNGGISIKEITGRLRAQTHNGGLSLATVAGDVMARTHNGGVSVRLTGDRWEGSGLDVESRNGGVKLVIPEGYSAELETGTVNGRISVDFPITVQGRLDQTIHATLGDGGPKVRVKTKNGGLVVTQY